MKLWRTVRSYLSYGVRFLRISMLEEMSKQNNTLLGLAWLPLSTLILCLILALVFRHSDSMGQLDFFLYVLSGYVLWSFVSDSLGGSTSIVQKNLEFAIHNNLSLSGLFWKRLSDRFFRYMVNTIVLVLVILLLKPSSVGVNSLLFLPFLVLIVASSLAMSYLVNLTTIFVPDAANLIRLGNRFLFFASPIFWSVADGTTGVRQFLATYNPVSYYLALSRQVFGVEPMAGQQWIAAAIMSAVLVLGATIAFRMSQGFVRNMK